MLSLLSWAQGWAVHRADYWLWISFLPAATQASSHRVQSQDCWIFPHIHHCKFTYLHFYLLFYCLVPEPHRVHLGIGAGQCFWSKSPAHLHLLCICAHWRWTEIPRTWLLWDVIKPKDKLQRFYLSALSPDIQSMEADWNESKLNSKKPQTILKCGSCVVMKQQQLFHCMDLLRLVFISS